jgi:CelD/BcsL family acetyltransferase involved in cellulose biosynthesis
MTLDVVAISSSARSRIRDVWCGLEATSRPSYFLSWSWVETWLDALPASAPITLYVARRAGAPAAAFFLGARTRWRHRVLPTRGFHLNQVGDAAFDEICIEYNGVVHDGAPPPFADILGHLPDNWDELYLPALDADDALATGLTADRARLELRLRVDGRAPSPAVDLAKVRDAGDYLKVLGGNTRSQIRRSQKLYAARGKLALEVASSAAQALAFFDELVALHRRAWAERGQAGAFVPFVHAFHKRLIERRFDSGEIQLLRIRAGDATVGCLYNLVSRDTVAFYQSGLAFEADSKLKPGLVCHALAVAHDAAAGHRWYDFLGGSSRYKQSLSTDARNLVWLRLQKPRLRFTLEDAAHAVRTRVREHLASRRAAAGDSAASGASSEDRDS